MRRSVFHAAKEFHNSKLCLFFKENILKHYLFMYTLGNYETSFTYVNGCFPFFMYLAAEILIVLTYIFKSFISLSFLGMGGHTCGI